MQERIGVVKIVFLLAMMSLLVDTVWAQCTPPTQRTRFLVSVGTSRDTLWFGHSPTATIGGDTALCEFEYPPWPPTGVLYSVWVSPPGYPASLLGNGYKQDYRRYVNAAKVDTHRVSFQQDSSGAPLKFSWSRTGVRAICDSAVLTDDFNGVIVGRIRMDLVDSLMLAVPLTQLRIYRYGARLTGVETERGSVPEVFSLEQNYPNPFNPTTTIRFAIQRAAMTEISVYDLLGRRVAALTSETLAPGYYSVTWNGVNSGGTTSASGVYFVRMNAQTDNGVSFSAVRKLLLMK